MNDNELKALFDQMAPGYDKQWERTAPINQCLYFLLESVFAALPEDARILCVGAGTGSEILHLASRFPGWRFTAVEPARGMLDVCRRRADEAGIAERCEFHEGYLDSLPAGASYQAATSFLVSQFILDQTARSAFFEQIAERLVPGGMLASSDLSTEQDAPGYDDLLRVWQRTITPTDVSDEGLRRMKATYAKDVAVLPPDQVEAILRAGGFEAPRTFFQAGLIRAWFARRR
ncbi:MAG: class I SAM-dependent methyltransferase [Alcanivorax sp.]|nr:class I SAM-dependent methyltransferase [Alcanivorax sp.]HAR60197.1 SAM-dependent methyltransferase [Alcanivorax sp.]HBS14652.1 SAM-dependent methyltransferase [Alcanivorax sp.]HCJ64373.1 SAM-dependent methyltransferase [Alcanivorax sp.]HCR79068.1 SAM-dependent methyltransferase [Alcanivorax sp.]